MASPLLTAPRDLALDPITGDLVVGTDLSFTSGLQAVAQSCRIALQLFRGEWFLNLDQGIPYFQSILGQKPSIAIPAARLAFAAALRGVAGVTTVPVLNVTFDGPTRTMTIT